MILDMGLLSYSLPIFIGDLINYGGIFFCISCMHAHDWLNICIRKYCVLSLNHLVLNGCNYGIIYGVNSTFFFLVACKLLYETRKSYIFGLEKLKKEKKGL